MTAGHSQLSDWRMDCEFVAKPADDMVVKLYWDVRVHGFEQWRENVQIMHINHCIMSLFFNFSLKDKMSCLLFSWSEVVTHKAFLCNKSCEIHFYF